LSLLERIFHPNWFMPTATFIVRWFARIFYGLHVSGLENIPKTGGAVVACNHVSTWDPPIVGVAINRKLEFMAKKELFEKPLLRAVLRGLRVFPVDREGQDIGAIKEALRRLGSGRLIGIFVQGTRNAGDAEALDGASFLAQRAQVPLVPGAIWREGRAFHVSFGAPLTPTGRTRDDAKELTKNVMQRIRELIPAAEKGGA
jgi:1-acyl-sn-glycerol-3-phosphate acyltransferase